MRRRRPVAILITGAAGIAMLIASASAQARLVWNFTPSIPTGLYSIEDRAWQRGDRVALRPSGRLQEVLRSSGVLKDGRLLMKRVAAVSGDKVCRNGQEVSIGGLQVATARSDRLLPSWSGCQTLQDGDVFLLGEADNSFDGRYFGVTQAVDIVGPVSTVLTF